MSVRHYSYDVDDVQHLFASIIEMLSVSTIADDVIFRILADVCRYFKFGCGFVYEADHTRTFNLQEKFAVYATSSLPASFKLEKSFSIDDIDEMLNSLVHFQDIDGEEIKLDPRARAFESNTLMLVPITDDNNSTVVGLVGMIDRRRNILMSEQAAQAAKMVLKFLGNTIKLRILQKRLQYGRRALRSILDNTGVDIYVNDFFTHEILYVNESMAKPYGGLKNMMGKKCWQALYSDKTGQCEYCPQKKLIGEDGNPSKIYSWDYQRPFDGAWFRVLSAVFTWTDGRLAHIVSSVDITDNKNNEATIARMANYDVLTKLPNRHKLQHDYQEIMLNRQGEAVYLLFFDLDNFKNLNDTMGHQVGDELLSAIGAALMEHPLTSNHVYRYGGDEFICLYPDVERKQVRQVIDFLLTRFEQPWQISKAAPICRASIGVAAYPEGGRTLDKLLHNADLMMYHAKRRGRGMACFLDGEIVKLEK